MTINQKSKKKAIAKYFVRFKFDDGEDFNIAMSELELLKQRLYQAMANSDSPSLRKAGNQKLLEAAERAASSSVADLQRVVAGRKDRPASKSSLRAAIVQLMKKYRAEQTDFKTFIRSWEGEALDGLRLKLTETATRIESQKYTVDDENDAERSPRRYTYRTLRDKLWVLAGQQ